MEDNNLDIKKVIKGIDLDAETVAKIEENAKVENEKDIVKTTALNETIKTLKAQNGESAILKEKLETIAEAYDIDLETEDIDAAVTESIEKIKKDGGNATPEEVGKIQRELTKQVRLNAKLQKQVEDTGKELDSEKSARVTEVKRRELIKTLSDNSILKPDKMVDMFMGKVKQAEDGSLVIINDTGVELPLSDGIADWASEYPEFVDTKQTGGAGGGNNGDTGAKENSFVSSIIASKQEQATAGNGVLTSFFGDNK